MNTKVQFIFPDGKVSGFTIDDEDQEIIDAGGYFKVKVVDPVDLDHDLPKHLIDKWYKVNH